MIRFALFILPCLVFGLAAGEAAAGALLRGSVVVEGDMVKLGDLFDNIGDKSDIAVAHAPAPGHRMTVDADWLQGVAASNDVDWHSHDPFEQVVIERMGVAITREQIEAAILPALKTAGADPESQIGWDNRSFQLIVPLGGSTEVGVRDVAYDAQTQHFTALIEYGTTDSPTRLHVSGRLYPTIELPVIGRSIAKGDVITAQDISWVRMRTSAVRRDALTDADQIIGMTPRQTLRANQAVAAADIQRPLIVLRGATVTMTLKYGAMLLSAQGRAIDQGSLGDVIHLTNTHSNMTVEGVIDAPNHVTIALTGNVALAN